MDPVWRHAAVLPFAAQRILGGTSYLGRLACGIPLGQHSAARAGGLPRGSGHAPVGPAGRSAGRVAVRAASGVRRIRGLDLRTEEHALRGSLSQRGARVSGVRWVPAPRALLGGVRLVPLRAAREDRYRHFAGRAAAGLLVPAGQSGMEARRAASGAVVRGGDLRGTGNGVGRARADWRAGSGFLTDPGRAHSSRGARHLVLSRERRLPGGSELHLPAVEPGRGCLVAVPVPPRMRGCGGGAMGSRSAPPGPAGCVSVLRRNPVSRARLLQRLSLRLFLRGRPLPISRSAGHHRSGGGWSGLSFRTNGGAPPHRAVCGDRASRRHGHGQRYTRRDVPRWVHALPGDVGAQPGGRDGAHESCDRPVGGSRQDAGGCFAF